MPRTLQSRKFFVSFSPRTPVQPAETGNDGNCLLCGLNFKLSGQNTWRSAVREDKNVGFINGVDNVNWPPYRDSKS